MESGRCSVYNTGLNLWQPFGSKMNTYRAGGSMTRMGKFIIATGMIIRLNERYISPKVIFFLSLIINESLLNFLRWA